jgi:hypothetical protein
VVDELSCARLAAAPVEGRELDLEVRAAAAGRLRRLDAPKDLPDAEERSEEQQTARREAAARWAVSMRLA